MHTSIVSQTKSAVKGRANTQQKNGGADAAIDPYLIMPRELMNAKIPGVTKGGKWLLVFLRLRCRGFGYCRRNHAVRAAKDYFKWDRETVVKYVRALIKAGMMLEHTDIDGDDYLIASEDESAMEATLSALRVKDGLAFDDEVGPAETETHADDADCLTVEAEIHDVEAEIHDVETAQSYRHDGTIMTPFPSKTAGESYSESNNESNNESIKETTTESCDAGHSAPPTASRLAVTKMSSFISIVSVEDENSADQEGRNSDAEEGQRAVNKAVADVESELMMDHRAILQHVQDMRSAGDSDGVIAQVLCDALQTTLKAGKGAGYWTKTARNMASERRGKAREQASAAAATERLWRSAQEAQEAANRRNADNAKRIADYLAELEANDRDGYEALRAEARARVPIGLRRDKVGESLTTANVNTIVKKRLGLQ